MSYLSHVVPLYLDVCLAHDESPNVGTAVLHVSAGVVVNFLLAKSALHFIFAALTLRARE